MRAMTSADASPQTGASAGARTAPFGVRNRRTVTTRNPSLSNPGSIENSVRSERIGYSNNTSSIACSQKSSVPFGSRAPVTCDGLFVGCERLVRFERDAGLDDARLGQPLISFIHVNRVGDPQRRRVPQEAVDAGKIQIAGPTLRKVNIAHRLERRAHDQAQ